MKKEIKEEIKENEKSIKEDLEIMHDNAKAGYLPRADHNLDLFCDKIRRVSFLKDMLEKINEIEQTKQGKEV